MVELYDKETHTYIGTISHEELQFLIDHLEEENLTDKDYYLNRATLEFLKERGLSSQVAKLLEDAMGDRDEIEITYKEDLQKEIE